MHDQLIELGGGAYAPAFQILGNGDDAADAVQDSIVTALRKPRAYDPAKGPLKPWFLRVVRNRSLDCLQQRKRTDDQVELLHDDASAPEQAAEQAESDAALWQALSTISTEHREIIVLRDYLGLAYAELADVLQIPPGTVMSRVHRARLLLRDQLSNDGGID